MYEEELKKIEAQATTTDNVNSLVDDIEALSKQLVFDLEILRSYRLSKVIDEIQAKHFEKISPKNVDRLNLANVRLKFTSLPRWSENVVASLFENDLALILGDDDIGLLERLNAFLIQMPITDRDKFKQRLLNHLRDNKGLVSNQKIVIEDEEKSATVANIISDYFKNRGASVRNLDLAEYKMKNRNYLKMGEIDKAKIDQLIKLLSKLTTSSLTPEGIENDVVFIDEDGKIKGIEDGNIVSLVDDERTKLPSSIGIPQDEDFILPTATPARAEVLEPINSSESNEVKVPETSQVQAEIVAAYRGDAKMADAIEKEIEKVEKKFGADSQNLRSEFMLAVQKKNVVRTIAILRILTQVNDLENFIKEDEKLNKFLAVTWGKQYGEGFVAEFQANPAQPKFIRTFLRYILEERLGMSANEAARVGQKIGNIFVSLGKKSYNKMAYFDVNTKTFNWFE